jgi:hypothetical protein
MPTAGEAITFTLPRSAVGDMLALSATLLDRMHELLERNTDGLLSAIEREELDTLVRMAQFGQMMSMALEASQAPGKP